MKRFLMLLPWVMLGTLILALTSAGSARAGIPHNTGAPRDLAHVINLHKAYEARLGHTTQGKIAGIVYPTNGGPSHGRGGTDCGEPYCPVQYNGGSVQLSPHVYLLLWGPHWLTAPSQEATATYLENFYSALGGKQDHWSPITSQYGDSSGNPMFGSGVYEGVYHDPTTPPHGVAQSGLAAEADAFAAHQGITDLNDAQIVIATQAGTCPQGFLGTSCNGSKRSYCAWHSSSNVPYTNLPYLLDAGKMCGEDFVNHSNGLHDGFSIVGGHEYAETITDPYPTSGWTDSNDPNYSEIADKCAWLPQSNDVVLSPGKSFAMQPLWSNNTDDCVLNQGGKTDIVSVTNPQNQNTYQYSSLSLYVGGGSTGGNPLIWSATGLPSGLTIGSSSSGVGVISGQITADPGNNYEVTVTATDSTGAYGWATFTWNVEADVGSTITNQASGTCLSDSGKSINPGNQVFMWKCLDGPSEMFTQSTNAGELIVLGQCLTDGTAGHQGPGTLQIIEPCTGAVNQVWFHNSKNEYVVEENSLCLTDPGGSTLSGEPAVVEKCTGAADQLWSGS
jgi:hypothetical protein